MTLPGVSPYLSVWTVISLRPASQQAAVRREIVARGAKALSLPALRLSAAPDAAIAERTLRAASTCAKMIFTSPAAVRFAHALQPLVERRGQQVYALGRGTARALARHGVQAIHPDERSMRSDGLLALPDFARKNLSPTSDIGLVTAPGGRGQILHALRARGAQVRVAEVYRRLPPRFDRRHFEALARSAPPRAVLLTSAEALVNALDGLPPAARAILLDAVAVASSERLAALARSHGYVEVLNARGPMVESLLDALDTHAARQADPVRPSAGSGPG